jgi:hypothetical protein
MISWQCMGGSFASAPTIMIWDSIVRTFSVLEPTNKSFTGTGTAVHRFSQFWNGGLLVGPRKALPLLCHAKSAVKTSFVYTLQPRGGIRLVVDSRALLQSHPRVPRDSTSMLSA